MLTFRWPAPTMFSRMLPLSAAPVHNLRVHLLNRQLRRWDVALFWRRGRAASQGVPLAVGKANVVSVFFNVAIAAVRRVDHVRFFAVKPPVAQVVVLHHVVGMRLCGRRSGIIQDQFDLFQTTGRTGLVDEADGLEAERFETHLTDRRGCWQQRRYGDLRRHRGWATAWGSGSRAALRPLGPGWPEPASVPQRRVGPSPLASAARAAEWVRLPPARRPHRRTPQRCARAAHRWRPNIPLPRLRQSIQAKPQFGRYLRRRKNHASVSWTAAGMHSSANAVLGPTIPLAAERFAKVAPCVD